MSMHDKLTITITGHGTFECTANEMDRTLFRYLPGSCEGLRQKIEAHPNNTEAPGRFDGLITHTEYLMVLAHLDSQPTG